MTRKLRDEHAGVLRFGGGINSRATEDQIHDFECADGQNFILDPGNSEFRPRAPFDLLATAPNAAEIRGFVTLQKTDGTVTMLVQAGNTVYSFDGVSTFTPVGTVASTSKIRGTKEAFWALSNVVLVTDLNLAVDIMTWNGTTLAAVDFLQSDGSSPFGNFRAKYCVVDNERAFFANIEENSNDFPHLLVASERGNYLVVSASARPSSSLSEADPWFLPAPQLKPINGLASLYGSLVISQEKGAFEILSGDTAQNYKLDPLHARSGASGNESVVSITNDIVYGALGKIESVSSTDKYGNVEIDDISFKIKDEIEEYDSWTLVYNPSANRVYCFPDDVGECWVLHTDFIGGELSPWSKWTTAHSLDFKPTAVMLCRDPANGLEYVFMGDASGNIYRMEGTGEDGDGGTSDILSYRVSKLFSAPLDTKAFHIEGYLKHRKRLENTADLTFQFAGEHVHDIDQTIALSESDSLSVSVYGGSAYYGGSFYYGASQVSRIVRREFATPGQSNEFQIYLGIQGVNDFSIIELGFRHDIAD